jgi:hypothetical protein
VASPVADDQLLAVDEALDRLGAQHPPQAELVKLRYFVGMTVQEAADVLAISADTAKTTRPMPVPGCLERSVGRRPSAANRKRDAKGCR